MKNASLLYCKILFGLALIIPLNGISQNIGFQKTNTIVESIIGTTYYDLQTQSSIQNRIIKHNDGSISAVWMQADNTSPNFADRGTGYNYFNGASWNAVPLVRLESIRSGWPSVASLKNGSEYILSHNARQIQSASRSSKGTGVWKEDSVSLKSVIAKDISWSRVASGGTDGNSLHVIALTKPGIKYKGLNGALTYSRSTDGGNTWDMLHTIIPGIDSTSYLGFNSDNYAIDAVGDTLAIVLGGYDRDVALLKSVDNGTTWTKKIVFPFPIPKFDGKTMKTDINSDGIGDTLQSNDGSVAVLIDKNGLAHVFFGNMFVVCSTPGTGSLQGLRILPSTDSLMYWNENMNPKKPISIAHVLDLNTNGKLDLPNAGPGTFPYGRYQVSLTSHPSAGIDASGTLYLAYSSVLEPTNTGTLKAFRHTYVTRSVDNGNSWSAQPIDVYSDPYTECVYASLARNVDSDIHLIYQRDEYPGISIDPSGGVSPDNADNKNRPNSIVYAKISTLTLGLNDGRENVHSLSIYPNPASGFTNIYYELYEAETIQINIFNLMGQEVMQLNDDRKRIGINSFSVDLSQLSNGIYYINSIIGQKNFTNKLIINKN